MQAWIAVETQAADFGDERLNARYRLLLERWSDKPSLSIPAACRGLAETTAAYRFCDNAKTAAAQVLQPHRQATVERVRAEAVVIVAQDTTEIELTRKQEKVGGPLNDLSRWGLYVHPLLAMTPERVPLGVVDAEFWSRDAETFAQSRDTKRRVRKQKPFAEKESSRWRRGYESAGTLAEAAPNTKVVLVSDSEGDIYECLQGGGKAEWIVRGCQDRALQDAATAGLWTTLGGAKALGTLTIQVNKRTAAHGDGRQRDQTRTTARQALVTVRAQRVELRPPARPGGLALPAVSVNVVLVREENPPAGEAAIEWLLLTSLPIETFADVCQVIDDYCCRWEIEIYFRVLKSGCKIEELQFEREDRYQVALALYMIVAWRVLYVLMLGRQCPEMRCDAVFEEAEWKSVYVIAQGKAAPAEPPPLGVMVKMIAAFGGYLDRKSDGPPGPQTMWIGLQRTRDFAAAWQAFGPERRRKDV